MKIEINAATYVKLQHPIMTFITVTQVDTRTYVVHAKEKHRSYPTFPTETLRIGRISTASTADLKCVHLKTMSMYMQPLTLILHPTGAHALVERSWNPKYIVGISRPAPVVFAV